MARVCTGTYIKIRMHLSGVLGMYLYIEIRTFLAIAKFSHATATMCGHPPYLKYVKLA